VLFRVSALASSCPMARKQRSPEALRLNRRLPTLTHFLLELTDYHALWGEDSSSYARKNAGIIADMPRKSYFVTGIREPGIFRVDTGLALCHEGCVAHP
jgi:hypothetical protein